VDPAYTGRVGASEAALFLKKSGLSDIILGKVGKMKHGFLHPWNESSYANLLWGRTRTPKPLSCNWWV
jgi:hypothetical protein